MSDPSRSASIGEGLSGLRKHSEPPEERVRLETEQYLRFATERLGAVLPAGARILDFGCGLGQSVQSLLDLGYDGYGVDIVEYWGRQHDQYWATGDRPQQALTRRLFVIEQNPYRLPFPDGHFDFCFSQEVMEHVFNHAAVFSEIRRVLKPGAISVHRFPGPCRLIEDHTFVPIAALCRSRAYLAAWALLGRRSPIQYGLGWRETLRANIETMRFCTYPTKRRLRNRAAQACADVAFLECEELLFRGGGRLNRLLHMLKHVRLDGLLLHLLNPVLQRYMVLR